MIKLVTCVAASLVGLLAFTLEPAAQEPGDAPASAKVRLGTFDSRALAVAWAASDAHDRELEDVREEHEAAKARGDAARVAAIDARMRAHQDELHKQGFGVWPVDDILEHVEPDLPRIAADARADVIVCKWDVVYRAPDVELIDVTRAMVAPFDPSERTLRMIEDLMARDPVPLEELEKLRDH